MRVMKDKRMMEKEETVLHEGYEGQKVNEERGNCPS